MSRYIQNQRLFSGTYFNRVISDVSFPRKRELPPDGREKLKTLLEIWREVRPRMVRDLPESEPLPVPYAGLSPLLAPLKNVSEESVKTDFILPVLEKVLDYSCDKEKSLCLDGLPEKERNRKKNDRPDLIVFREKQLHNAAVRNAAKKKKTADALSFCRDADFILDVKKFSKGIGADEDREKGRDTSAAEDIDQVERYTRGCGKTWGILTNGRSWRLMRKGKVQEHLRFDLVLFLEDLNMREDAVQKGRGKESGFSDADMETFALFFHLFGHPAVGGGYLNLLYSEGEASSRRVKDILRDNAHTAVQIIAESFWKFPGNAYPEKPCQDVLDHLRELSLTFLYRLLFILKAEAQGLLPMRTEQGAETLYASEISTWAVFSSLKNKSEENLRSISTGFDRLRRLFELINSGGEYEVPAYDGGLFDPEIHAGLEKLRLNDDALYAVLNRLIYLDKSEPVPYADLDVRDFGDIYEGLLEQRLILERIGKEYRISLRNRKGERKASGSWFTPDSLVDHIVRETLNPLLEKCRGNPHKILSLKILDPAMGSGHFLVKVVDVTAWHLTLNCAPVDKGIPDDNGPAEFSYWKRKVVEHCIYGVDVNPMAVELAKVSLWLHSASLCKPLSFLDHHLKCGNSLVGADLRQVSGPGLESRELKSGTEWVPRVKQEMQEDAKSSEKKGKKIRIGQLLLPLPIDTGLFSGILESVREILRRPSNTPQQVKSKHRDYLMSVNSRLEAHRILCDLWCAQWFLSEPDKEGISVYESPGGLYARVKKICGITDESRRMSEVEKLKKHAFVKKIERARQEGYGPRPMRFFHWQLEFPEAAFTQDGELKENFGFDAVVGNPPWDKIKPAKRDFYGQFSEEVANRQGTSLNALIAEMEKENPQLAEDWQKYEKMINCMTAFLSQCGAYEFQTADVEGRKTGGDPDLFRYFTERAGHFVRKSGRAGLVVPCTLWQGHGCTGLRRRLFERCTMQSIYTFENYRKWAFGIHSSFKFSTFVFSAESPPANHSFPAAFMLRDTRVPEKCFQEPLVSLSYDYVKSVSPTSLALIDIRSEAEARFIQKIHKNYPVLGSPESGWNAVYRTELHMTADSWRFKTREWMKERGFTQVLPEHLPDSGECGAADTEQTVKNNGKEFRSVYRRELDMSNDSWRFKTREWMKERGFTQILPVHGEDGAWMQKKNGPVTAKLPEHLSEGGEYWVSADADWYRERGYREQKAEISGKEYSFFIHPEDAAGEKSRKSDPKKDFRRIFPAEYYTALYEGRMVHIFDHSQKRYLRGQGRKAVWEDIPVSEKMLQPRVFFCKTETGKETKSRIGFCDITGATNERSILAAMLGPDSMGGNKVPCLMMDSTEKSLVLLAVLCSFCGDALIRLRISTNLTWNFLSNLAVPKYTDIPQDTRETICQLAAKLNCTTPELAEVWNEVFPDSPWSYASAERDLWKRAEIRAKLDSIIAELYGLTVEEYAVILTGFPLLDRDQPPLAGDYFLTEGNEDSKNRGEENKGRIETEWGIFERRPRSFITRDFALLTYMKHKNYPLPRKLDEWYRDKAGFDPEGFLSRFRIGEIKDLMERVETARKLGAVPYIPTARGESQNSKEDETENGE
ncbi:MAG: N-6 DNA methylase [Desulfococcaceae bacterium]